jgi:hypothetical protein
MVVQPAGRPHLRRRHRLRPNALSVVRSAPSAAAVMAAAAAAVVPARQQQQCRQQQEIQSGRLSRPDCKSLVTQTIVMYIRTHTCSVAIFATLLVHSLNLHIHTMATYTYTPWQHGRVCFTDAICGWLAVQSACHNAALLQPTTVLRSVLH